MVLTPEEYGKLSSGHSSKKVGDNLRHVFKEIGNVRDVILKKRNYKIVCICVLLKPTCFPNLKTNLGFFREYKCYYKWGDALILYKVVNLSSLENEEGAEGKDEEYLKA